MTTVMITRKSCELGVTDVYHLAAFHGLAMRNGEPFPFNADYSLDSSQGRRLEIIRSGPVVPHVFQPAENLVISDALRTRLLGLANVVFLEVRFIHVVDFSPRPRDFTHLLDPVCQRSEAVAGGPPEKVLLMELPDVPAYHELLSPSYEMLVPALTGALVADALCGAPPPSNGGNLIRDAIDKGYEVIRVGRRHIVTPMVYSILENYIDRDFFTCHEFQMVPHTP